MKDAPEQAELFGLIWQSLQHPYRLRVNDLIRIDGRLGRIIRVNDCAAVVLMNRPPRDFSTRFDKRVRFQPPPVVFRISVNAEREILNRTTGKKRKQLKTERRIA